MRVEGVLKKYGLCGLDFSDELIKDSCNISSELSPSDKEKRVNFTGVFTVTIDKLNTGCREDALGWSLTEDGGEQLLVSILDASPYVHSGSELDREAAKRGRTLYGLGESCPMLPPKLAFDVCSLVPDRDRPAITLVLKFDATGRHVSSELVPSLIRSNHALTYGQVDALLAEDVCRMSPGKLHDPVTDLSDIQKDLSVPLRRMRALCLVLMEERRSKGDYVFPVSKVDVVPDATTPGYLLVQPADCSDVKSNSMIEFLMNCYNVQAAEFLTQRSSASVVKILSAPGRDELNLLYRAIRYALPDLPAKKENDTVTVNELLEIIRSSDDAVLSRLVTIRLDRVLEHSSVYKSSTSSLAKESFWLKGCGGFKFTTSCTSPARSYVDLVVQRQLNCLLQEVDLPTELATAEGVELLCEAVNETLERVAAALQECKELNLSAEEKAKRKLLLAAAAAAHKPSQSARVASPTPQKTTQSKRSQKLRKKRARQQLDVAADGTVLIVTPDSFEVYLPEFDTWTYVSLDRTANDYHVFEEILYMGSLRLHFNSPVKIAFTCSPLEKKHPLIGQLVKLLDPEIPGLSQELITNIDKNIEERIPITAAVLQPSPNQQDGLSASRISQTSFKGVQQPGNRKRKLADDAQPSTSGVSASPRGGSVSVSRGPEASTSAGPATGTSGSTSCSAAKKCKTAEGRKKVKAALHRPTEGLGPGEENEDD